jgi:hypothetical protein
MLTRIAKPVFVTVCGCNLAFSVMSALAFENFRPEASIAAMLVGGLAFVVALTLAFVILKDHPGMDRPWIKAALVFLMLGPLAFWGLEMPARAAAACIDNCYGENTAIIQGRAVADIIQSQVAMIAVALAAVFCAARAMTTMLDDLAV